MFLGFWIFLILSSSVPIESKPESLIPKVTYKLDFWIMCYATFATQDTFGYFTLQDNFGLFSCAGDKLSHRSDEDQSVVLLRLIRLITWGNQDREPENWRTLHNRSGIRQSLWWPPSHYFQIVFLQSFPRFSRRKLIIKFYDGELRSQKLEDQSLL